MKLRGYARRGGTRETTRGVEVGLLAREESTRREHEKRAREESTRREHEKKAREESARGKHERRKTCNEHRN
jgi:hypothetical protein